MPLSTALNGMNSQRVSRAISRARLVLPTPGGPQRITELSSSRSICRRSGLPGPSTCSWPGEFVQRDAAACGRPADVSCPPSPVRRAALYRTGSSGERPLAPGFVQQDAGRNRRVQGFHARRSEWRYPCAAERNSGLTPRASLPITSAHLREKSTSPSGFEGGARAGRHAGVNVQLVLLQRRARQRRIQSVGKRHAEQRPGRRRAALWD